MIKILSLLSLIVISTNFAMATCQDGSEKTFYLNQNPSTDNGPGYSCADVSRVKVCKNGSWSNSQPTCEEVDSGGCADYWVDQLHDNRFQFDTCNG